jgi:hypothetical protein
MGSNGRLEGWDGKILGRGIYRLRPLMSRAETFGEERSGTEWVGSTGKISSSYPSQK